MKKILLTGVLLAAFGLALAKLPPPQLDEAAKAKAAETTAKAAWQAKVEGYLLCKAQDKVAAAYRKTAAAAKPASSPVAAAAPAALAAPAAPAASATTPVASAPVPAASAALGAASGTPVASSAPPPCTEPGPFAYNAPEQKPLETSGAHSPTGTAASPPSVKPNSAEMAPNKK
jgi:hypothetical protein